MERFGIPLSREQIEAWIEAVWTFSLPRLWQSLGILVLAAILYVVARWILRRIEDGFSARTRTRIDDILVRAVRRAALLSITFWAVWRLAFVWELGLFSRFVGAIWIVALTLPLARFTMDTLRIVEERVVPRTETDIDDTALPLINRAVQILIVTGGALVGLEFLGISIGPFLAGAGVLGLALSLAAKDTLSNLFAGILLILDRPFKVGDRIELWSLPAETGTWGDVVEIGLRATRIRNPDNLIVIVPNNEIMMRDIVNYTASGPDIRLRIPLAIAYDADVELAKKLILEAIEDIDGIKREPNPVVIVRRFGESAVDLELRVWIDDARHRRSIGDEVTGRVKTRFSEGGVEIPYPKRDLYIKEMPDLPPREDTARD